MSQQINLYNSALLPSVDAFAGRTALLSLGGILLFTALIYGWVQWNDAALAAEHQRQQVQLTLLQSDIARLAQDMAGRKASPQLTAELESMDAMLIGRNEIMTVLNSGTLGDTQGVSEYFRAFARESVDGLWLTGFSIEGAGKDITIEGRTLRAELVPDYISQLRHQDVLRGHSFGTLNVQMPPETTLAGQRKTAEFLEFQMSSRAPATGSAR
ncbi:MAG TPA: hypothetical protein VML56_01890 [Burkholderiales bacterium]|nr:hypothetical protein [Burkholderiales bacterium]